MDFDELEKLNKEFAEQSIEMQREFNEIFKKWFIKSPRMTTVNAVHLPLNLIMYLIDTSGNNMSKIFPELPDMFKRFLEPFILLKGEWGKIPDSKFLEEYRRIYESQFEDFIPNTEMKDKFKKWFEVKK